MNTIHAISICSYFILISLSGFSQTKKLKLKEAVETGLANNLLVQQSGLQVQNDEVTWKQSKLNQLPNLNGSAGSGISQGRSIDPVTNSYSNQSISYANYGLNSGVILFNGMSLRNTVKQNALTYQASKMDWQQAKDNLSIDIILAYLTVLNNEDQLQQARNQSILTKQQLDRLNILNESGATTPSLLSDLKGQYANDQLTIISLQNSMETAKVTMSQLMNVPYDKNLQLERISAESFMIKYETGPEAIYQESLQKFPQVKADELRRQSAEKAITVAKGGLFPTLSLNGFVNTNYSNAATNEIFLNSVDVPTTDYVLIGGTPSPVFTKKSTFSSQKIAYGKQLGNNLSTGLSLNLRIPIFNAWQSRNRIKLAQITLKNEQLTEKTTKTQLQQFIEQAWINMNSDWERYKTLLEQIIAYKESFRAAGIRFESGVGNSVDYLTAKNNLDRAEISVISAKYDYVLRTKILDYYQGKAMF